MPLSKREFLKATAGLGLVGSMGGLATQLAHAEDELPDMAADAKAITAEEHQLRLLKAQALMQAQGIAALVLEAGSALVYFTGIQWWRSERFTGVVVPAEGEPVAITPYFEEPSVRESVKVDISIHTWNEHENPFDLVAGVLSDA